MAGADSCPSYNHRQDRLKKICHRARVDEVSDHHATAQPVFLWILRLVTESTLPGSRYGDGHLAAPVSRGAAVPGAYLRLAFLAPYRFVIVCEGLVGKALPLGAI